MKHDTLFAVFVVLYLLVIAALLIKDVPLSPGRYRRQDTFLPRLNRHQQPKERSQKSRSQADDSGKPGATPNCEKELRRTADLLRFFANSIQAGEDTQSVVADMRQQEKRISSVCD